MAPEDDSTQTANPAKHSLVVLWVCGIVILGSAFTVIYATVFSLPQNRMTYNILIILMCFSASTVSGLLFASTTAQLKGTVGVLALSIGGPAALWLIALVVMQQVLPPPSMPDPEVFSIAQKVVAVQEQRDGWQPFSKWLTELGDLNNVFKKDEEGNLRQLLSGTYLKGGDGRKTQKLRKAVIQSLFVYPSGSPDPCADRSIKLQHIAGERGTNDAAIFIANSPTIPGGKVDAAWFARGDNFTVSGKIAEKDPNWVSISSNPVEFFLITNYCDKVPDGDWLQTHVPKYIENDPLAKADTVETGIASARAIRYDKASIWEVRTTTFPSDAEFPLLFRPVPTSANKDLDDFKDVYHKWLNDIEDGRARKKFPPEVIEFLNSVAPYIARVATSGDLKFVKAPNIATFHTKNTPYQNVMTFLWNEQPAPAPPPAPARGRGKSK